MSRDPFRQGWTGGRRAAAALLTVVAVCSSAPIAPLGCSTPPDAALPDLPVAGAVAEPRGGIHWLGRTAIAAYLRAQVWLGIRSGFVAVFARDGHVVHALTEGFEDLDAQRPMRLGTRMRMASMTKPLTAVAAMMLVEEGRLGLDDPVARYLPAIAELAVAEERPRGSRGPLPLRPAGSVMTVRHLLSFRSGLGGYDDEETQLGERYERNGIYPGAGSLAERIDRVVGEVALYEDPGTRWRYGWSHDVLARVVEIAAGEPFGAFVRRRILEPLGMASTGFLSERPQLAEGTGMATLYTQGAGNRLVPVADPPSDARDWTPGGSGLVSTATDYLRFALMLWNEGEYDGVRLLEPETVALMQEPLSTSGVLTEYDVEGLGFGAGLRGGAGRRRLADDRPQRRLLVGRCLQHALLGEPEHRAGRGGAGPEQAGEPRRSPGGRMGRPGLRALGPRGLRARRGGRGGRLAEAPASAEICGFERAARGRRRRREIVKDASGAGMEGEDDPYAFDPFDPGQTQEQWGRLAALRRDAPVSRPAPGFVYVARYADVKAVFRDTEVFSSAEGFRGPGVVVPEEERFLGELDPPSHPRLRTLLMQAFVPGLDPRAEAFTRTFVEERLAALASAGGGDLVSQLGTPLPAAVTAHALGVPDDAIERVVAWSSELRNSPWPATNRTERGEGLSGAFPEFARFLDARIAERRRATAPPDDLLGRMVRASSKGRVLSGVQIRTICANTLLASQSTANLVGNLLARLLGDGGFGDALRANSALIPAAVEESLRFEPPVLFLFRTAKVDTDIAGHEVKAGERVILGIASGNRDETVYERADEFWIERGWPDVPEHLTFAPGPHHCLGSALARMQARIVLETMLEGFEPGAVAFEDGYQRELVPAFLEYGPACLPVRFASPMRQPAPPPQEEPELLLEQELPAEEPESPAPPEPPEPPEPLAIADEPSADLGGDRSGASASASAEEGSIDAFLEAPRSAPPSEPGAEPRPSAAPRSRSGAARRRRRRR